MATSKLSYLFSEYDKVPHDLKTDAVMPLVSELPQFISNFRHPRRNRSVSVGPQSEADAYETLAFRDKVRRDSRSSGSGPGAAQSIAVAHDVQAQTQALDDTLRMRHQADDTVVDSDFTLVEMPTSNLTAPLHAERTPSQERREDEKEKKEIFSKLEKPRVRYDVEVVTKLIVYTGRCLELILQRAC